MGRELPAGEGDGGCVVGGDVGNVGDAVDGANVTCEGTSEKGIEEGLLASFGMFVGGAVGGDKSVGWLLGRKDGFDDRKLIGTAEGEDLGAGGSVGVADGAVGIGEAVGVPNVGFGVGDLEMVGRIEEMGDGSLLSSSSST